MAYNPQPASIDPSNPDRVKITSLQDFINETRNLFESIINDWSPILFMRKHRDSLNRAWLSFRVRIDGLINDIQQVGQDVLQSVGLAPNSPELNFKLEVLSDYWSRFWSKGTVEFLLDLLGMINNFLKSLGKISNTADAWEELKTAIENLIKVARSPDI